jgi:hypothetical protein
MINGQNKILLALSVLMLIVGYAAGSTLGSKSLTGSCNDKAVRADITKKLTEAGLIPAVMPIMSLSGKVTAIDENRVTVEVPNQNRNPLEESTPKVRVVTIADGAVITLLKSVSPKDFLKAQQAYEKKQTEYMAAVGKGENPLPPSPPSGFIEEDIKLSDLKAGMTVTVTAESDITSATSFAAKRILAREDIVSGGVPGLVPAPSPVDPGAVPMPTPAPAPAPTSTP